MRKGEISFVKAKRLKTGFTKKASPTQCEEGGGMIVLTCLLERAMAVVQTCRMHTLSRPLIPF